MQQYSRSLILEDPLDWTVVFGFNLSIDLVLIFNIYI